MADQLSLDLRELTKERPIWSKDFTIVCSFREEWRRCLPTDGGAAANRLSKLRPKTDESAAGMEFATVCSLDEDVLATFFVAESHGPALQKDVAARANFSLCCGGEAVSITMRLKQKIQPDKNAKNPSVKWEPAHPLKPTFLTPPSALCKRIVNAVSRPNEMPSGLILFAGSTKSGKTDTAKSLALNFISRAVNDPQRPRRPHLVTFEDPIEPWQIYEQLASAPGENATAEQRHQWENGSTLTTANAPDHGFDFTPRVRTRDTPDLESAVLDAKRQTPSCFYIGEIRKEKDWRVAVEFAGSGHLVVATTHAGSLCETVARVMRGTGARTPAERGAVAGSILACIHQMLEDNVVFSSMWIGSHVARNALVTDGLSSVVPNGEFVLSRRQFAEHLIYSEPAAKAEVLALALDVDLKEL